MLLSAIADIKEIFLIIIINIGIWAEFFVWNWLSLEGTHKWR